jgi:hypothetical protein
MMEGTAGDRWEEFYSTCRHIIDSEDGIFNERERDFAESMEKRLDRFGADTYLSTKQIKWLTELEEKATRHGL